MIDQPQVFEFVHSEDEASFFASEYRAQKLADFLTASVFSRTFHVEQTKGHQGGTVYRIRGINDYDPDYCPGFLKVTGAWW